MLWERADNSFIFNYIQYHKVAVLNRKCSSPLPLALSGKGLSWQLYEQIKLLILTNICYSVGHM